MSLFFVFMYYLNEYGKPFLCVAALVLGIIIICTKDKATKMLGIWAVAGALGNIIDLVCEVLLRTTGAASVSKFAYLMTILALLITTVAYVMLFLYARSRYALKNYILIVLFAVNIGMNVINRFLVSWIVSYGRSMDNFNFGYLSNAIGVIPALVTAVMVFIIFFKNRPKEKELKLFWLYFLISLIITSLYFVIYFMLVFTGNTGYSRIGNSLSDVYMILRIAQVVILLFACIYILIKGRKSFEDEPLEIV